MHIYNDRGGALYVDSRFVGRQTMWDEDIEISLPFDCILEEVTAVGFFGNRSESISKTL